DRERQGSCREGDAGGNRRGDGRPGCHIGDALEQDLAQADRVAPQPCAGLRPLRCRHSRLPGRSQMITAGMFSRQGGARPVLSRTKCAERAVGQPVAGWPFELKPCRGSETSAATSAASRTRSPSVMRTCVPGSTPWSLTKLPLVECSSRIVACPVSLTVIVACRLDTFS